MNDQKIKKYKTRKKWNSIISFIMMILIGVICGYLIGEYAIGIGTEPNSDKLIVSTGYQIVSLVIAIFLHIIIHESGHLIGGLLSGYEFSSFRIGSFMIFKENEKICLKRFSLAGTGGQCLMVPPEMINGKIPYILYNLGGVFANLIVSLIALLLWNVNRDLPVVSVFLLSLAVLGIFVAFMNGIPLHMGKVDNDGYNTLSLSQNSEALLAFWLQMKINDAISRGIRLREMPEKWFFTPSEEGMKNSIIATVGVFKCNRFMDQLRFEEADELMEKLISMKSNMVGIHKQLLISDRIYCELIGNNRTEVWEEMLNREQKSFMKSMKNFPSVMRTEYAYHLLGKFDKEKADKVLKRFEKVSKTYPYKSEIESELELIESAEKRWRENVLSGTKI